jgi:serine/threonine-protein kinase
VTEKETETAPTVRVPSGPPGAPGTPAGELRGRFRYRLIRRLGRGSFGSVYLARCVDHDPRRDDSPPAQVALKILRTTKGPALDMLRRELAALLAIQNDRIPHVFDWSIDSERAFVAIEYFPAGSLRELMNEEGPVEEAVVWRMLNDVLSALDVAHRAAVLHLDMKPANVLIDDEGGFVLTTSAWRSTRACTEDCCPSVSGRAATRRPSRRGSDSKSMTCARTCSGWGPRRGRWPRASTWPIERI